MLSSRRPPSRALTPITPEISRLMPKIADHTVSNHITPSLRRSNTYYNTARNAVYSRYSTNDWDSSNRTHFNMSDRERAGAERLRQDAWRLVKATEQQTRSRQSENTKKLGERVSDIAFWKSELNKEMRDMENEIENLLEHKRVLEKAFSDTKGPQHVAEECLLQREKRRGIDMVHDGVEKSLSKEVEVIRKCQEKMNKAIEQARIQLKLNRFALHTCDLDSKDKQHAECLDDRMHQLRHGSASIGLHPGIENIDNTLSVPVTWLRFTQENITRSQREREASERLRGEIDALLRACANEMWSKFNSVNNSFNARIHQTNDAKNKLQAHLQRTFNEIKDLERALDLLRKAIHDKELPMKLAQTRLEERTRRVNVEICNDPAMKGLQREVAEIRDSVRQLRERLREGEQSMARLQRTRATLQHDIEVKENSITIDSKYCMGMRKQMPMEPTVAPIFTMPMLA